MNRKASFTEKELKAIVRTACDDVRLKLEKRRDGGYITKSGLVDLINQRAVKSVKANGDSQQALIISMLPAVVPGYWFLIRSGLLKLVSEELQRKVDYLPQWESYYDQGRREFNWIPAAVITSQLAAQMSMERREGANTDLKWAKIWDLVGDRLNGTKLLFADVREELRPQIKAILAR